MKKRKVYLDCGSLGQYKKVKEEYENDEEFETDNIEFIYLLGVGQLTEKNVEIWRCSELDRAIQGNYNVVYHYM